MNPVIHERLLTLFSSMGYALWGYEFTPRGRQTQLCLYIDKPGGVTVDDCSQVGRQVRALFAVEDPMLADAYLEVSSPGINKPLFELSHYQTVIGKQIKIKLRTMQNNKRHIQGLLSQVEGDNIYLLPEGEQVALVINVHDIVKAHLVGDIVI